MKLTTLKLITIIAEDELEQRLVAELKSLGATGYTLSKARGEGTHRTRTSEWEGENIRIEALVSEEVASRILDRMASRYFKAFGLITYVATVEVIRGEKFLPTP